MTDYLGLYILTNVFCIALVTIAAIHSRVGIGAMVSQRRFAACMYVLVVFFASDTIWYAMDCGALPQVWTASMLLKSVYFLSATLAGFIWFLYMGSLTRPRFLSSRRNTWLAGILVWIHLALIIANWFSPILFGIDDSFVYFRGPFFSIQYVFVYCYLLLASCHALYKATRPENYIDRARYVIISLFPVLPAISGILQLFYWRIPFNCVAFTLGVVIVYLTELGQQISQEPLTQLANRKQFMRVLDQHMDAHRNDGMLYLFMIDIDRFKAINDTLGHVEGDRAIIHVGEALKNAVNELRRRATLARYGGDEFAIIALFENPNEAEQLKQQIIREIAAKNAETESPYELGLSIGIAQCTSDMRLAKDLINAADEALYQEKQRLTEQ